MTTASLGGAGWRRLARFAASRTPDALLRVVPPAIGLVVWALAGDERRALARGLARARGPRGALGAALDTARAFATYASCLTETLTAGSRTGRLPDVLVRGELNLRDALALGRGLILATAHTAGWETVGPLLSRDFGLEVMIAVQAEPDVGAAKVQDDARRRHGLRVAHVGADPLAGLELARHLRAGGTVALQIDRTPPGMRCREVSLFGRPGAVPEGPLRLAGLTGAPIVPVFVGRLGHRRYEVTVHPPLVVPRAQDDAALDAVAQRLAAVMEAAIVARPTQWFAFDAPLPGGH